MQCSEIKFQIYQDVLECFNKTNKKFDLKDN